MYFSIDQLPRKYSQSIQDAHKKKLNSCGQPQLESPGLSTAVQFQFLNLSNFKTVINILGSHSMLQLQILVQSQTQKSQVPKTCKDKLFLLDKDHLCLAN